MTLSDYSNSYGDFSRPLMYVEIEGKKISDESIAYTDLYVELTTGNEASFGKFSVIANDTVFSDDGRLRVSSSLKGKFKLGSEVNIYLGYMDDSKAKLVFSGFITAVNFEYTGKEDVVYSVEAMDLKVFMMNNSRSELKKDMKKYSDVVVDMLKDYSVFFRSKKVDTTPEMSVPIEQYNQSDYDFIASLARRVNYWFFVVKGEVKFVDCTKLRGNILTITPSEYLYLFEREVSINKQLKKVVVRTNDEKDPGKPIEGSAVSVSTVGKGSKSGSEITKLISDKMEKTIIDNSVKSESQAKSRAQAELNRLSMDLVSGRCEMVGIPELEPGMFISVKNMDSDIDSDYIITGVEHIFNAEGYRSICKFGANKI